jgi:two-component system, chemotaxis family, CheB/CheR fusion protein
MDSPTEVPAHPDERLSALGHHVVGIGASAGGLEALEALFAAMPRRTGMSFVIVQHLSPDFESRMDELLSRHTTIPVVRAADGMHVEPDHVYLLPPRKEMIIAGGRLLLTDIDPKRGFTLPIDHFLRSLATDAGPHAVAVVLSGTGTDASRGIRAIHDAGGLVVCQSEGTAKFDGMPRSALMTGCVDLVLPPGAIPPALVDHVTRAWEPPLAEDADTHQDLAAPGITRVFQLLRAEYGIDFTHYKPNTVMRRIERRLTMGPCADFASYVTMLTETPAELSALYGDLLIGVTRFFRDREAFERVASEILPAILEATTARDEIRVWCAGCATGEEAYSLAILLHEQLTAAGRPPNAKIFATDVHRQSLDVASTGIYDDDALADVSLERRERYFVKRDRGYQVSKELRQMIVFAPHNVISDAPFTRLDLLTCRNLLIYFQTTAQKRAISLFHFALKTGGYLMLGPSETPAELSDEFDAIDKHWKIFRKRRDIRLPAGMDLLTRLPTDSARRTRAVNGWPQSIGEASLLSLYDRLLVRYMPAGLLVDGQFNLLHSFGGAERFVRMRAGRVSANVLDLVLPELKITLAAALQHVAREQKPVRYAGVALHTQLGDEPHRVQVEPFADERAKIESYLITFESTGDPVAPAPDVPVDDVKLSRDRIVTLETELQFAKESLQNTIEELETSNEELQATNEELVASNEELQATNEELHSVNEELYTVNSELQRKITEISEMTADLDSVLETSEVGVLFLDRDLSIRKFTPKIVEAFQLLPQDVGRKLEAFSHRLDHSSLLEEVRHVVETGRPIQHDVVSTDGRSYLLRVLPYQQKGRLEGVVVTLLDIGALRAGERNSRRLAAIVESSADAIVALDLHGKLTHWNGGAERLYGYSAAEAVGQPIDLIVPAERSEETRRMLLGLASGESVVGLDTLRRRRDGAILQVSLHASPIRDVRGEVVGATSIDRDVTARRHAEDQVRRAVKQREQFLAILSHELRNPLAAVLSAAHLLTHGAPERAGKAVQVIGRQTGHMARLLDDLLDVSRVQQGKLEIRVEPIDLRRIGEAAVETVTGYAEEREVRIETAFAEGEMLSVGDPHRLRQLIINLLRNAARHSERGGTVSLRLERDGERARVVVRDEGSGIAPELLGRIFEPFAVADPERSDGLGIGLWLARTIAEAHGGQVRAESDGPGRGAEFTVEIPIREPRAALNDAERQPLDTRLLLVEDQHDIRELLFDILTDAGMVVHTAADGEQAMRAIDEHQPHIALVDLGLPGMSGLEMASRVRAKLPPERLRLIALTGFGQETDRQAVFQAGFDQHLVKPVDFDVLLGVIRSERSRVRAAELQLR